jgi:hypothetical protein
MDIPMARPIQVANPMMKTMQMRSTGIKYGAILDCPHGTNWERHMKRMPPKLVCIICRLFKLGADDAL